MIQRGAIAMVWEGFDARLERKVLVKQIHEHIAQDEDLRTRFEREARAIARLKPHPNVVQVYELSGAGSRLAIVLEWVEGISLSKLVVERGPMPPEIAATIMVEILNGLEQIHQVGVVHRDLKPANVLVSNDGEIKITDFGFATLHDQPSDLTLEGTPLGTPAYMAPEQAHGETTSTSTDVFAAGLVLFELLVGRPYVQGEQWQQAFQFMREYKSPQLAPYRNFIPRALMPVMWRMLRAEPAKRFATAAETRTAVITAVPNAPLPRTLIKDFLGSESVRKPAPKAVGRSWSARRPLQLAASAILLAGLAFFAAHLGRIWDMPGPASDAADSMAVQLRPDSIPTSPVIRDSAVSLIPTDSSVEVTEVRDTPVIPVSTPRREESPTVSPTPTGPGWVELTCNPWAFVSVGDSVYGETPLRSPLRLESGSRIVMLRNSEIGFPLEFPVKVVPGETTRVVANLYEHVARVRAAVVKPWADVYINGKLELRTPDTRTIFLPFGTYEITLKHPDYPPHTYTMTFREGNSIHEINVDLAHL